MFGKSTSRGPAIGDHDPNRHDRRGPAPLAGNVPGETPIAIDLSDQATDITDCTLHLDDEECAPAGMPSDDIDGATLTENRERDLGMNNPRRQARQATYNDLGYCRVGGVEHAVEIRASPTRYEIDPRIERGEGAPQDPQVSPVDVAAL